MGIAGIYQEIGPGKRVSLSKLTSKCITEHGRPLRIAVDAAIWHFQTQAGKGGVNADLRTFFYRLARLLATPVQPIFVFDGPNKPDTKRNHSSRQGESARSFTLAVKRLIQLFGLVCHDAPGEAEAECALLQQRGIVDAVLSEDVDTLMFGCTRTLRKWTPEKKSSKIPTHVSVYDTSAMSLNQMGLDRQGMILIALMSGGDYDTNGLPKCGPKVACEAAKAGFGRSLCRLKAADTAGFDEWRHNLQHELHSNESGYFRTKHKIINIPKDFPNLQLLRYYTHPVVSSDEVLEKVKKRLQTTREMDIVNLRDYAQENFDWSYREGGIKFIRVINHAALMQKLICGNLLLGQINGQRSHVDTDKTPELRVTYIPADVVPIDISAEEPAPEIEQSRGGLALNSDNDAELPLTTPEARSARSKSFDIQNTIYVWVLETVLRQTVPSAVGEWEEQKRLKEAQKAAKTKPKATKGAGSRKNKDHLGKPQSTLNQFLKVTKNQLTGKSQHIPPSEPPSKPKSPSHQSRELMSRQEKVSLPSAPRTPRKTPMDSPIVISSSPACPGSSDTSAAPTSHTRLPASGETSSKDTLTGAQAVNSTRGRSGQLASLATKSQKAVTGKTPSARANRRADVPGQTRLDTFFRPSQAPNPSPAAAKPAPAFIWPKDDDFASDSGSEAERPNCPPSPLATIPSSPIPVISTLCSRSKRSKDPPSRGESPSMPTVPKKLHIPEEPEIASQQAQGPRHKSPHSFKKGYDRSIRISDIEVIDLTGDS